MPYSSPCSCRRYSSRESRARSQCKNNLKQLGLALHNYHDSILIFPLNDTPTMQRSGFVGMLPYLEQGNMWNQMNQSVVGLAAPNLAFTQVPLPALLCPSDTDSNRIQFGDDGGSSINLAPADYAFSAGDYTNGGQTGTGPTAAGTICRMRME